MLRTVVSGQCSLLGTVQAISLYYTSFLVAIFFICNSLASSGNILQILCVFLFSANKLWRHIDVGAESVCAYNLYDGLNF